VPRRPGAGPVDTMSDEAVLRLPKRADLQCDSLDVPDPSGPGGEPMNGLTHEKDKFGLLASLPPGGAMSHFSCINRRDMLILRLFLTLL